MVNLKIFFQGMFDEHNLHDNDRDLEIEYNRLDITDAFFFIVTRS